MQDRHRDGFGLSQEEIAALEKVARKHVEEVTPSILGLPFISSAIRQELLSTLALDEDFQTLTMLARIRREPIYPSIVLASQMAEEELGCLQLNCSEQTQSLTIWLATQFWGNVEAKNSAAIGSMLVFKAFHLLYGPELIEGFGKVPPREVGRILSEENRPLNERNSIVGRAIRRPGIPVNQFNSDFVLTKLAMHTPNKGAALDGGTAMFKVLDANFAKMGLRPL